MSELWQAVGWNVVVACVMAACVWTLGRTRWLRRRPALEQALWLLVLVKLVLPPLFAVPVLEERAAKSDKRERSAEIRRDADRPPNPRLSSTESPRSIDEPSDFLLDEPVSSEQAVPKNRESIPAADREPFDVIRWCMSVAPGFSLTGTLVLILCAARPVRRIGRLVAVQSPVTTGRVAELAEEVGGAFGLARPPEVALVPAAISPFLWAPLLFARPRIVLPSNLVDSLNDDALRHVIAHETAHHVRRDPLTNGLAFLIAAACWWNPLAWFARRSAALAAEACCDAVAIQRIGGSRKAYAQTLMSAVDFLADANAAQPATLTRFGSPNFIKRRIEMIADPNVKARIPGIAWMMLVAVLVGASFLPVHARTGPSGSETRSVPSDERRGIPTAVDRGDGRFSHDEKGRGQEAMSSQDILRIEFSMNRRADGEFGGVVERYVMSKTGETLNVTDVTGWAHQAGETGKLDEKSIGIVVRKVKSLPAGPKEKIPPDRLTTVMFREDENITRWRYSREELPAPLEEVIELLGGLRPRLKGKVQFTEQSKTNPAGTQGESSQSEQLWLDDAQRSFARTLTDADLKNLPRSLESLELRGNRAYGIHRVTNEGIPHLIRLTKLRVLDLSGHGLTDQTLESIANIASLEELRLDSNRIIGSGLRHLAELKKLRRLSLNFNPLQPNRFASLGKLNQLVELSVEGTCPVNDQVLEHCGRLTDLQWLRLSEDMQDVTDQGLSHLTALKQLKNLTLKNADKVSGAGLGQLAQLPQLEYLSLRGLRSVTPAGLSVLRKLSELRGLEIVEVHMDAEAVRILSPLKKLETLLLWNVSSESLPLRVLGELHSLRELRTNQTLSGDAIRALGQLKHLESIRDELKTITDEDLMHLAQLPKIRFLALDSNQITAASLPTLAKMKSLRQLFVTRQVKITPQQWHRLGEDSLPQCRISSYSAPYTVYHDVP